MAAAASTATTTTAETARHCNGLGGAVAFAKGSKQRQGARGVHTFAVFALYRSVGFAHRAQGIKLGLAFGTVIFVKGHL